MKLALTFTGNNPYDRCGIFIKHASPKVWLAELKRMQLNLSDCKIYPCPGLEANSISGAIIILQTDQKNIDIGNITCIQQVRSNFFIPEHTQLNMALTDEEYVKLLNDKPHFLHYELGLIELTEELRWETILAVPTEQFPVIETPAKGVKIPAEVTAFSIEIEEAEEDAALENVFGDTKVNPEDLPFDMKKVLKGNNAEIEKYLKYLERNPEAALKMAIPLDMMGTSRGKAFANYRFKSNFFESVGLGNISNQTKNSIKTVFGIIAILFIFWIGYEVVQVVKQNQHEVVTGTTTVSSDSNEEFTEEDRVIASENTNENNNRIADDDWNRSSASQNNTSTKTGIIQNIILVFVIIFLIVLIFYLADYQKKKVAETKKDKKTTWLDLPEESELFSFTEEDKHSNEGFYFGGDELSMQQKIIVFLILIGLILYLFYPMITKNEVPGVLLILVVVFVFRMLYTLLNKKFTEDDA